MSIEKIQERKKKGLKVNDINDLIMKKPNE